MSHHVCFWDFFTLNIDGEILDSKEIQIEITTYKFMNSRKQDTKDGWINNDASRQIQQNIFYCEGWYIYVCVLNI